MQYWNLVVEYVAASPQKHDQNDNRVHNSA